MMPSRQDIPAPCSHLLQAFWRTQIFFLENRDFTCKIFCQKYKWLWSILSWVSQENMLVQNATMWRSPWRLALCTLNIASLFTAQSQLENDILQGTARQREEQSGTCREILPKDRICRDHRQKKVLYGFWVSRPVAALKPSDHLACLYKLFNTVTEGVILS